LVSILSPHHRRILPIPFDQESSFSDSLKCFFDSIGAQVRQQVIATLGRVEELRESGQLERLLRSGARFAVKEIVVDALNDGTAISADVRRVGPALVFERLWDETGCRAIIEQLAGERKHGFALKRAVFLTVLHLRRGRCVTALQYSSKKPTKELVWSSPRRAGQADWGAEDLEKRSRKKNRMAQPVDRSSV
jgi:hypothetical protein